LAVVEFATLHGVSPAAPRFGLDRKTVRAWRDRAREAGAAGLVPRYPARRRRIPIGVVELIAHARQEFRWGACRIRMWLMRVHQVQLATKTISKICDDLGLPRPQRAKRRRAGQQLKLFEKATPGESVQVDVKVVKVDGRKAYQYTAIDDCTRLRVLRLYRRRNVRVSQEFLGQMIQAFPFPIRTVQTDRGQEFSFAFLLAVERHGIRHRYIQPRRPDENGKGERSHRIDAEEFWSRYTFETFEAARAALHGWERTCVHEARFSMALHGRAPAEKLAAVLAAALTPDAPVFSRSGADSSSRARALSESTAVRMGPPGELVHLDTKKLGRIAQIDHPIPGIAGTPREAALGVRASVRGRCLGRGACRDPARRAQGPHDRVPAAGRGVTRASGHLDPTGHDRQRPGRHLGRLPGGVWGLGRAICAPGPTRPDKRESETRHPNPLA